MKPSIPFTHFKKTPDAIRWYIVGAYLADASEADIVSLTNLSRQTVSHFIRCFNRTGMPNVRRRKRTRRPTVTATTTDTKKPLTYYDAWSDLEQDYSDSSSDDDQYESNSDDTDVDLDIKKEEQDEAQLAWKQSLYFRRKGHSSATDTIDYVLYKGRKYEEKRISTWQKSQNQIEKHQRKQNYTNPYDARPPSPPLHSNRMRIPKLEPKPTSTTPSNLPPPRPSSSHSMYIPSFYSLISATDTIGHHSSTTTTSPLSSSPSSASSSSTSSPTLPRAAPSFSSQDHLYGSPSSSSRFNLWSRADDKLLLYYALTHMRCWDELDQLFEGRHSAQDCSERWDLLQHYLFKELTKAGTHSW